MQQKSKSKISFVPLLLIIGLNLVAFLLLKGKGLFILAIFFTPIFQFINRLFLTYEINDNAFIIKNIFAKVEIPIDTIRYVENKEANPLMRYVFGMPSSYQILGYNTYDDHPVYSRKELIFVADSRHLYFKN